MPYYIWTYTSTITCCESNAEVTFKWVCGKCQMRDGLTSSSRKLSRFHSAPHRITGRHHNNICLDMIGQVVKRKNSRMKAPSLSLDGISPNIWFLTHSVKSWEVLPPFKPLRDYGGDTTMPSVSGNISFSNCVHFEKQCFQTVQTHVRNIVSIVRTPCLLYRKLDLKQLQDETEQPHDVNTHAKLTTRFSNIDNYRWKRKRWSLTKRLYKERCLSTSFLLCRSHSTNDYQMRDS